MYRYGELLDPSAAGDILLARALAGLNGGEV